MSVWWNLNSIFKKAQLCFGVHTCLGLAWELLLPVESQQAVFQEKVLNQRSKLQLHNRLEQLHFILFLLGFV